MLCTFLLGITYEWKLYGMLTYSVLLPIPQY